MPETLHPSEQAPNLPLDDELRGAYLPICRELVAQHSSEQGAVNEDAVNGVADLAVRNTWWKKLPARLKTFGVDPEVADNMQLVARHSVDIDYRGEATNQGFTVFELGEEEEDRTAIDTAVRTLELIDQWSGGWLAANPARRINLALTNGFSLYSDTYKNEDGSPRQNAGLAFNNMILISMPYIRDIVAQNPGVDFHNLLAYTITHEILGHRVEGALEMNLGDYYRRHFDYSDPGPGALQPEIFRSITSKEGVPDTHPVNEYGSTGPEEDVATSIDSVVATAMGWDLTNRHSPRLAFQADAYRDELAMHLLDKGAQFAKSGGYFGVPGYIGSEVYYDADKRPQPARTMRTTTSYGEEALRQELRSIALQGIRN